MYLEVSDEFKNAVRSNTITSTARLTFKEFFSDGTDLIIDEKNITQDNGLTIIDYCYNDQNGKLIGTTMTKEVEVEIKNTNNYDLEGKIFDLEVGILTNREESTYEYVSYGSYIVTSYEDLKSSKKYKLIAYDLMSKLNPPYIENTDFVYTVPITLKEFYRKFMQSYGIEIEEQELPNENFVIQNVLDFEGATGRTILGYIAELFGSFAKINRNNKCQMYLKTETEEKIDLDQMNTSLEIDNRYGPVNVVSIGLSQVEGENVTLEDGASILEYGETTIRIDDNPFVYTEELREQVIDDLFNRLNGFTYIPVKFKVKSLFYTDGGDSIQVRNIENNEFVDTIILNQKIKIPQTRQSTIESKALTNTAQKNKYISKSKQAQTRTEILVDKAKQRIEAVVSDLDEAGYGSFSELVQDLEGIKTNVGFIADLTATVAGLNPLTLEKCLEGELQELRIQANNTIFNPLYPSSNLYPSSTLYPRGKTYLKIIHQEIDENDVIIETTKTIDLNLSSGLKMYNSEIYDEFIYSAVVEEGESKGKIIRRVGVLEDGTLYPLSQETIESVEIEDLLLGAGTNIITFNEGYYGLISAIYIQESTFTKIFATTYEVNSFITQLSNSIDLLVKEKVGKDEVIADLNVAVKNGLGIIQLIANSVIIDSDHCKLSEDGVLTLRNLTTEPYVYTINDVITCLEYLQGTRTLTDGLLDLYDYDNDGEVTIFDVAAMKNIVEGKLQSTKYANAEIIFNPLSPSEFIKMTLEGETLCRIGLNEIYNYSMRGMYVFLGSFADMENRYGISLNGEKGEVLLTSIDHVTTTKIDANHIDTYYVLSSSQNKKGRCLHGIDESHDYLCHWNGTNLQFYVDSSLVGSLSDERLKTDKKDINIRLVNAIKDLELKQFKLKNKNGKISVGIIAQDLIKCFKDAGLDINDYDFITESQYDFNDETLYYIVEYEQFLILYSKLLRNKIDNLESKLEKRDKIIEFLAEKLNCKDEVLEMLKEGD